MLHIGRAGEKRAFSTGVTWASLVFMENVAFFPSPLDANDEGASHGWSLRNCWATIGQTTAHTGPVQEGMVRQKQRTTAKGMSISRSWAAGTTINQAGGQKQDVMGRKKTTSHKLNHQLCGPSRWDWNAQTRETTSVAYSLMFQIISFFVNLLMRHRPPFEGIPCIHGKIPHSLWSTISRWYP